MVTCIVLIDSTDSINVTFLRDNKILSNYVGNLPISHFINNKIDLLKVVFKPTLCNSVSEDAFKIGNVQVNSVNKSCVISYDDFNNLSSLLGKVPNIEIINYIDIYKDAYKDMDSVVVVDSWNKSLASVVYIEFGSIVDFRRVNYSNLPNILSKFTSKHNCHNVINGCKNFDYVGLNSSIVNLDKIEKERLPFLKHVYYCLEHEGSSLTEQGEILDWSSDEDKVDNGSQNYYARNIDEGSLGLDSPTDIDDPDNELHGDNSEYVDGYDYNPSRMEESPSKQQPKGAPRKGGSGRPGAPKEKVGFFAKLFGKKNKVSDSDLAMMDYESNNYEQDENSLNVDSPLKPRRSNKPSKTNNRKSNKGGDSRFSAPSRFGDDDFSFDDDDDEYGESSFSQLAVGDHRSSRKPRGFNPNVRKYSTADYLFYVGFTGFMCLAFIFGGLQLVYKEKVGVLSDTYNSAIKMKNQMESSVEVADNAANSPVTRLSQINNLALPNSYKINNVEFNGNEYRLTLSLEQNDNIDDFSGFLPEGLTISRIDPKGESDNQKIYDVVLVLS